MTPNEYLAGILVREAVDTGPLSPVRGVQGVLAPILGVWGGGFLSGVAPSGSFAKGTANRSGTDIDLFVSLAPSTPNTLKQIYETLFERMRQAGYAPKRQNVSINVRVGNFDVDLVPAKRQDAFSAGHSLYRRRKDTWTKTNVQTHIAYVRAGQRLLESRILKLWRNQKNLDFPSFYLELATMNALAGSTSSLSDNVWRTFQYLRDTFPGARIVDPANTNNIISDDLSVSEKQKIRDAAASALGATDWNQIVV
jgi:Nucleotidyltransferase domain